MSLANKIGVEVDDSTGRDHVDINLTVRNGQRFKANFNHTYLAHFPRLWPGEEPNTDSGTKADGWGDVLDTLQMGIETCDEDGCEYCAE